jgi:alpha-1,3-rhamnosyl/mannosyltransferase
VRFPAQQPPRRRAFLDRHLSDSLARADRVIVPTRFIRDELTEVHGLGPERVRVVPEGVDPGFRPRAAAETAAPLARHGLRPGGYLLSVGTLEPRKNLETLVAAVADLPATVRRRWPLVLVGAPGWRDSGLAGRLAPLVREGSAKVLGHVPDPDLRALYAGARGVAYLSTYEGFGLPCLEAMASGAPLLISTAPALREVTAGAGLEAPAGDVDAVRQQLQRLLEDTALRVDLACRGRDRAAGLTWLAAASATRAVYAEVLAPATAAPPREAA